jgi:heterodisulfide reductase subunit C/nitrate reductase gamma subunit
MAFTISLYAGLAIFALGLVYKIGTWFTRKTSRSSQDMTTAHRLTAGIKGIILAVFSRKILTMLKVLILDGIFQRKVFRESPFRWLIHILLYGGFMLLLLMHALDRFIAGAINPDYAATLNPFLLLRDLFGALVIIGLLLALYRRFIMKAPRLTTTPMDTYAIVIVAVIMLSGIILEGVKITSYTRYQQMVEDYAGLEEGEDDYQALTAFWVKEFHTVAPDIEEPLSPELIEAGRELHEMSCMACHAKPQWAFTGYLISQAVTPIALPVDRAGIPTLLWYIHFLSCFVGLAYLPFSKFIHVITTPLSLVVNSVMDPASDEANMATRQALEMDACMHCGTCTNRCSVGVIYERIGNAAILPSEKLASLKHYVRGQALDEDTVQRIGEGVYLCTNCRRCTDSCPAGINLEELWFTMRERLLEQAGPTSLVLSPFSFFRGLNQHRMSEEAYTKPLTETRAALTASYPQLGDTTAPLELTGSLALSAPAQSFSVCFGCQTCTNVCPVVASYENPQEVLGMLPHQIMHATNLGIRDLALGSMMLWDCVTCYQCQEHCPQGVKVTEVLYELKNLAITTLHPKEQS